MGKSNEELRHQILNLLRESDQVNRLDISVHVKDGIVKLTGKVPSYQSKNAAESDVSRVVGVRGVENQLEVSSPGDPLISSDDRISFELKKAIYDEPDITPDLIQIKVNRGNVTLKGSVDRYWKKQKIEDLTLEIEGVGAILNELTIVPANSISDEIIAERIARALNEDMSIAVDSVDIEVENGIVTLRGVVPDSLAHARVTDIIKELDGVAQIHNKLDIIPPPID